MNTFIEEKLPIWLTIKLTHLLNAITYTPHFRFRYLFLKPAWSLH